LSSRDFGVEQFFRADEFRAVDPSPCPELSSQNIAAAALHEICICPKALNLFFLVRSMPKNIFLPGVYYQIHDVFKWDLERKRIRKTLKDRHI
jgi:hypothetical protein